MSADFVYGFLSRHGVAVFVVEDGDEMRVVGPDREVRVGRDYFVRWMYRRAGRWRTDETCSRAAVAAYAHPTLLRGVLRSEATPPSPAVRQSELTRRGA